MKEIEFDARRSVLTEANLAQVEQLQPNVAVLPWGATEAHNRHLPHGTDTISSVKLAEAAADIANARGGRCLVLPAVPFGSNSTQLKQVATINIRSTTEMALIRDVAESLVLQGIDRLVIVNFHGGNEFKPFIRDVMLDLPIFIVRVNGYQLAPMAKDELGMAPGEHADEFETSLMMHIAPGLVAPLAQAGEGKTAASQLPALSGTPGVWAPRDWAATTSDTGIGDPHGATPEKGAKLFDMLTESLAAVLAELSAAEPGMYPFILNKT